MSHPSWAVVVARVNRHLGRGYRLVRPLSGGRQGGAWIVTDEMGPAGAEWVLTWTLNHGLAARREETAWLVEQLRGRGYPTPRWHAWGGFEDGLAFVIAAPMEGTTTTWDNLDVGTLIDAVERQAGLARPGPASWSAYLRDTLASDHGPRGDIAAVGPDGLGFLRLVDQAAASSAGVALPDTDAVHGDLESSNILVTRPGDAKSPIGIIDIDACGPGTRAIDYAWLVRDAWAHDAPLSSIAALRHAGVRVAGGEVWGACVAFACLELVAFVARAGSRSGVDAEIRRLTPLLRDV